MSDSTHGKRMIGVEIADWTDDAACSGLVVSSYDPWHDPDAASSTSPAWKLAKRICDLCPVRLQCKYLALEMLAVDVPVMGMYGGLTPKELEIEATVRGMTIPPHGTRRRYLHRRCRCDDCRAANVTYQAERRKLA